MEIKYLLAFGCSLLLTLIVMPTIIIPFLHKLKFGQSIRNEGPASHMKKKGTPTMGGMVFVIVPVLLMLLIKPDVFVHIETLIVILAYVGYSLIGFIDDFLIVVKKNNDGLKPAHKFLMQLALAIVFYLIYAQVADPYVLIPILNVKLNLGIFYIFFVLLMFTAESNAVNLTDGLDGLCASCFMVALAPYIIFALLQGKTNLVILLLAVEGSLLGYLRYNAHPAKIFMGDTGSLALGGLIAAVAMVVKQELLLVLIGGVFLMETLSVIIQVTYYKKTKKRIFKMTPIHHHFELSGLSEVQVVLLFCAIQFILSLLGLWIGVM